MESPSTRDLILDAAEEFLARRRLREMTVRALMAPLPWTREAFYKHFSSRYDVIGALLDRFTEEVGPSWDLWAKGSDPLHDVRALFETASLIYQRRAHLVLAVVDASSYDPNMEVAWTAFRDRFIGSTAEQIRVHQERGWASDSVDARLCAAAMIHLIERLITQELASAAPPSRELVVELLTRVMLGLVYPELQASLGGYAFAGGSAASTQAVARS